MKKIMTIMASLATTLFAFGALGDVSAPPAGFESYNSGDVFDPSVTESESTYWYAAAVDDTNIITNYAETGTSVPELVTGVVRPDGMKENDAYPSNSNFLSLETSTPLFRSVQANNQDGAFTGSTIGDGIYLDTLVKFTASEEEFKDGALEANVDKIAIEYVEHGEESLDTNDPTDTPFTNFVIRAGYIGTSAISQKNYRAYLPDDQTLENFDKDAWHRLTVRTIANIGGNNVGFIVYLDQKPLAYNGVCGDDFSPSTDAQNYYNDEIHAVYPSAVDANITGGDQIAAVAFSGNGAIDDVVFTTTKPKFIENSESVVVPFVADAGVTAISVLPDGATDAILVDMTADTLVAVLPAQTTAFTVTATIDTANGYTLGGISYGGTPVVDGEVTGYAGGDITITTVRNNFNLFDANDDPISGTFQTLTEAFAAEGVAMIKLAYDYDALAFEGDDFAGYDIDSEIILDLNGNDLDGGDDSAGASLFRVADTLTIKDSVGGGSITYDTQYGYAIVKNDGSDVFIGAATGDAGATFNGKLFEDGYEGNIVKGYIDDANNADEGEFLWGTYVVGDSDYELAGDYWVVAPKGGSTTFALTTTGGANAEITTDPTDVSALTEETEVTITATATNGFTYATVDLAGDWTYDSQTDAISMTTNISENTTVVVPDAVSEQSQEDWPEGEALIDAEGKAAGDLFPGITNALATADAKAVATWAEANNIAYADKGSILPEAFLLNCANTQAAIDEAAANFKITAITVAGDTVTIAPADGVDYGNGKVVIEGTATLSPISWHEKTTGDHFFRATLVVKPVAAP